MRTSQKYLGIYTAKLFTKIAKNEIYENEKKIYNENVTKVFSQYELGRRRGWVFTKYNMYLGPFLSV